MNWTFHYLNVKCKVAWWKYGISLFLKIKIFKLRKLVFFYIFTSHLYVGHKVWLYYFATLSRMAALGIGYCCCCLPCRTGTCATLRGIYSYVCICHSLFRVCISRPAKRPFPMLTPFTGPPCRAVHPWNCRKIKREQFCLYLDCITKQIAEKLAADLGII